MKGLPAGGRATRELGLPVRGPAVQLLGLPLPPRHMPARQGINLLIFRSDYRQPFGTFSGELPGGPRLSEGYGVMESHDVRW